MGDGAIAKYYVCYDLGDGAIAIVCTMSGMSDGAIATSYAHVRMCLFGRWVGRRPFHARERFKRWGTHQPFCHGEAPHNRSHLPIPHTSPTISDSSAYGMSNPQHPLTACMS